MQLTYKQNMFAFIDDCIESLLKIKNDKSSMNNVFELSKIIRKSI